jgi:hypothetical protein
MSEQGPHLFHHGGGLAEVGEFGRAGIVWQAGRRGGQFGVGEVGAELGHTGIEVGVESLNRLLRFSLTDIIPPYIRSEEAGYE